MIIYNLEGVVLLLLHFGIKSPQQETYNIYWQNLMWQC